jgi:holo-[acyl-carrier protein] synthase
MPVRVGIDLVRTDEVRASMTAHGERYLKRIYTDAEQLDCGASPRRLAARFAAKEATRKVLVRGDEPLSWRSIGVCERPGGRVGIELSGEAATLAERRGVRRLELSLTHRRELATAIVVAELEEPDPIGAPPAEVSDR